MNRGIYSLASGMVATQQAMDVLSNNLANVNTTGFKRDQTLFNDALEQAIATPDGTRLGSLGRGATIKEQFTDQAQGAFRQTGNSMDLAIQGQGMFAVRGANGQVLYTRNGSFAVGPKGDLVTQQGQQVLDNALKPIQIQPGTMAVETNGRIAQGTGRQPYAQIGLFSGAFAKAGDGLYSSNNAAPTTSAQIKQNALEASNVDPVGSMVDMISLGRNFDLAQKSIQSEDDLTQRLTTVLS